MSTFFHSIRFRLLLWFTAILALVLIVFSAFVYYNQARDLEDDALGRLERRLVRLQETVRISLHEQNGQLVLPEDVLEDSDALALIGSNGQVLASYGKRIGPMFLDAGLGWGGSCFPKDVLALAYMAEEQGLDPRILNTVMDVNYDRRKEAIAFIEEMTGGVKGKTIGLLGLAFKPNTDDMRDAPSIDIAQDLTAAGAKVRAFDPVAMEVARPILPAVEMFDDPYTMSEGCDALMVLTEWNEFKQLDLEKVKGLLTSPIIFDGRNIYEPGAMKELGFKYRGMGRGFNGK